MIKYKSNEEIELIRQSSLLVGKTLAEVAKLIAPGIDPIILDRRAEEFIRDNGGVPAFKGYGGTFPNSLCLSLNDVVVHGIPQKGDVLEEGDIIAVDCGVLMNGYYGDSAYTFGVGEISAEKAQLLKVTKECLYKAIEKAVPGQRMGDLAYAVQEHAEKHGYGVVKELVGHGIGQHLHEKPEVPNYGRRGTGLKFMEGLTIAIEPMINMGTAGIFQLNDGWTIVTKDKMPSAHFEHTVAVRKGGADILSSFEYIEEVLNKK